MILISAKLLHPNLEAALTYNLISLCEEGGYSMDEVMADLMELSTREDINNYLAQKFPNTVKIVN